MLAGSQEGLAPLSGRCCPYLIFLPTHSTEASRIADYFGVEVSTLLDKGDDREEEKKPPAGSRELYAGDMEFWRKVIEYAPPEELKEIIIRATEKLADLK